MGEILVDEEQVEYVSAAIAHEEACWNSMLEMEKSGNGTPEDRERWQASHDLIKAIAAWLQNPDVAILPRMIEKGGLDDTR